VVVIGVIGLKLSSSGFEGIEASMLIDRRWAVRYSMLIMAHGERWEGPGWMKTRRNLFRFRSWHSWAPSKLWIVLSLPSLLVFIALLFSGLVMNFGSGFVRSDQNPPVTGFEYDSFNFRNIGDGSTGAGVAWQYNFRAMFLEWASFTPLLVSTDQIRACLSSRQKWQPIDDGAS
jgi:hypothetical protein